VTRESKILIAILVVVAGGMIGLFALANRGAAPAPTGDASKIIRDTSHQTGTGAVQIVEFGDFQCPACGAAHPHVKQLLQEYNGRVTFYFRNFPLTNIHPNAMAAAQAAEAAADQGKYWEMHNKLFESQKEWETLAATEASAKFAEYAGALGLDVEKFKTALADEQFKTVVDQDLADANALQLQSTPSFFFNGVQHRGQHDYASLREAIETALKQQTPQAEASPQASPAQ
jgi:protein-disulfide isomerase